MNARYGAWALRPRELAEFVPGRSAQALFSALHRPWLWNEQGPTIAASTRELLAGAAGLSLQSLERARSSDGAIKLICDFAGERVEAVHMPRAGRVTLCVSSQVGCAMGCGFCATAEMGLRGQLSAGQIVASTPPSCARAESLSPETK